MFKKDVIKLNSICQLANNESAFAYRYKTSC